MRLMVTKFRRLPKALRPQRSHIYSRGHGAKRLVGTNIAARLLPADMLFASLQGQYKSAPALSVLCLANNAAGQKPGQLLFACQEAKIGSAEIQRHAQRLSFTCYNIRALRGRRVKQSQRGWINSHDGLGARLMN